MAPLTHLPLVPHICVSESGQHWSRQWLVAYSAPSHYLDQSWIIVNWTLKNKHLWNYDQNYTFFIQEDAFENAVCEIAAISSRGDELRTLTPSIFLTSGGNADQWKSAGNWRDTGLRQSKRMQQHTYTYCINFVNIHWIVQSGYYDNNFYVILLWCSLRTKWCCFHAYDCGSSGDS